MHNMEGSWSDKREHNVAIRCNKAITTHLRDFTNDSYCKENHPEIYQCRTNIQSLLNTKRNIIKQIKTTTQPLDLLNDKIRDQFELDLDHDAAQPTPTKSYYTTHTY